MDSAPPLVSPPANVSPWSKHTLQATTPESKYQGGHDSFTEQLNFIGPPVPRTFHSSSIVSSPSGDIFIFGGTGSQGNLNDTWSIRLSENSRLPASQAGGPRNMQVMASLLETTGEVPPPRMAHQSALTEGLLVVWGGMTSIVEVGLEPKFGDDCVYFLNTTTCHWTRLDIQPAPPPRHWSAGCMCESEFIVFGGMELKGLLNDLWAFDLNSLVQGVPMWKRVEVASGSHAPAGRMGHTIVAYENRLYLFGGGAEATIYNDTWCFDMVTRVWTELRFTGPIPSPRSYHAAVVVEDAFYIFGEQRWYKLPDTGSEPPPTSGHILTAMEGRVFLIGGEWGLNIEPTSENLKVVHVLDTNSIVYPESGERKIPKSTLIKRGSGNKTKDLASAVLKVKKNMPGVNQVMSIDSLGSSIFQARSEGIVSPLDQETTSPTTQDTITGAMSAPEILRYLVGHGCHDISDDLDISHVSEYPISSGGFGDIYRVTLRNGDRVGLKCLRMMVGSTEAGKKFLKHAARELYVWSKCKHPNILELLGVMLFRDQLAMVSPWVDHGHLRWFLTRNPQVNRCTLCVQVINGVEYMHKNGMVHGDLKPENILVAEGNVPKLTDFGNAVLSEYTLQFSQSTTTPSMSMRWTSPEILSEETKTTQAGDVYALGMIIFEVITGILPYSGAKEPVIMRNILAGKVPKRPESHIPSGVEEADRLWLLLTRCWAFGAHERPPAWEVKAVMEGITPEGLLENRS